MDASSVRNLMSLIPERATRLQSGSTFAAGESQCRYSERLAHLAQFLHWMSPLAAFSREDQQLLGLLNAAGRPVHAADLEEELEDEVADELTPLDAPELQEDLHASEAAVA